MNLIRKFPVFSIIWIREQFEQVISYSIVNSIESSTDICHKRYFIFYTFFSDSLVCILFPAFKAKTHIFFLVVVFEIDKRKKSYSSNNVKKIIFVLLLGHGAATTRPFIFIFFSFLPLFFSM